MKHEVVGTSDTVALRLERTMKRFVLVLPGCVVLYGLLIQFGISEGSPLFSAGAFWSLMAATVIIVILETVIRSSNPKLRAGYMVTYHVLLAIALLFVFGVHSPPLIAWLLLIIATVTYYGKQWAGLSFLGLILVISLNAWLIDPHTVAGLALNALSLVFVGAVATVFVSLSSLESTEQQKLVAAQTRQSEQREALLTIINGASQAIFTVSSGGIIRVYNAALLSLLDTNQSLSGRKVDDVVPLHDLSGEPVSLHSLMKQTSHFERDDLVMRFADGDEMRLQLSVNKVQSAFSSRHRNDGEGYVCIARDVTKEKSLEEERDEFIAVVSHELRTPVAITEGTISNAQFFLEQGVDPAKLKPALVEAHEQVVLLASMINDLGTLSRAERGVGDDFEAIDVRALADELYKKYSDSARKKGLSLNLDAGGRLGTITTSRLYLEELLQNLITNAIKYTPKGTVTLQVHRTPSGVVFAVKDTGIGISKSDLKHIFEKFYRSEDYRTRETSGTGLGLYVVTKLMHKLRTKVEVSSRLNHGSTFEFTIADTTPETKA